MKQLTTQPTELLVLEIPIAETVAIESIPSLIGAQQVYRVVRNVLRSVRWHITQFGDLCSLDIVETAQASNARDTIYGVMMSQSRWRMF